MITLEQLRTERRFRQIGERELINLILSREIDGNTYHELEGLDGEQKARNLIQYFKDNPFPEEPLTLKEGMGVLNATKQQQLAVYELYGAMGGNVGAWVISDIKKGDFVASPHLVYLNEYAGVLNAIWRESDKESITIPVTFEQFIQAILNTPAKPKEVKVKWNGNWDIVFKDGRAMIERSCGVGALEHNEETMSAPLSVIDELVKAKNKVSR